MVRDTRIEMREERSETTPSRTRSAWSTLFSGFARPIRFFLVGQAATLTQLCVLYALTSLGWLPGVANAVALVLSSQVNFFLSATFTWRDRDALERRQERSRATAFVVLKRWARFMSGIAVTTLLNEGLFLALERVLPVLVAALISSATIAVLNYLMIDRLIFTRKRRKASTPA